MALERRSIQSNEDVRWMQALATAFPNRTVHVVDLPYRLASPALHSEPERDAALWLDDDELVGWAVWQSVWSTLDYAVHPAYAAALAPMILAWGQVRFAEIAAARGERRPYWVSAREDDADRIALLEGAGFRRSEWRTVRQQRRLAEALPETSVPSGFTIRPLEGEREVEAYVAAHRAAFGTQNMTVEFRRRVLRMPEYRPELDLVVEAPDGQIAAFTILWLLALTERDSTGGETSRVEGQYEPVGTHPDFQRRGLARALLVEGMRRVQAAGGTHAAVEADSFRTPARTLYESLMPVPAYTILHYAKDF